MLPFDVQDWVEGWRRVWRGAMSACVGAVFVAVAVVSIEYEEMIAPGLSRLQQTWTATAADLGRRFVRLGA